MDLGGAMNLRFIPNSRRASLAIAGILLASSTWVATTPRMVNATTSAYTPSDIQSAYSLPKWAGRTSLPVTLYRHASVFANGYAFIIGGNNGSTAVSTVYSAPVNADGSLGSWQSFTGLPQAVQ